MYVHISMILTTEGFYFVSKHKNTEKTLTVDGKSIKSSDTVKELDFTLDKFTNFKQHIQNIYHNSNKKIIISLSKNFLTLS